MKRTVVIYRRTATASTYLMRTFGGVYATTPTSSVDLDQNCFNVEYESVVQHILDHKPGPVVVINLVRNPFSRFVSQFFKNLHNERIKSPASGKLVENPFHVHGDTSFENLSRVFRRSINDFFVPHDYLIEKSYPRLFGTPIEDREFDYLRKHLYFESGRFRFLTLRQEDSDLWPRIVRRRIGHWQPTLDILNPFHRKHKRRRPANRADQKEYADIYRDFQDRFKFSEDEARLIRGLATYRHYYQDDGGGRG